MITNGFTYLAFLVAFAGIVSTCERKFKDSTFFKYVPTPVILYLMCMVFATFDLWQRTDSVNEAYRVVRGNLIPAMIFVMLLRCDMRKILKLGPRMLLGFFCATGTIMVGFIAMFALFKNGFPPESWKTWGALAGSWIGGTANMVAVQGAMGYTLLVDNVNYSIWVIMLLASVPYAHYFNRWTKSDTKLIDSIGETLAQSEENVRTQIEVSDLCLLLGAGLLASAVSSWLASIMGIACALTPLGKVPGSSPVSMSMLYIVICLIASRASFKELTDAPYYLLAGFFILAVHAALMALLAKLFKLDLFTCAVASLANIGAVAAAPVVAAAYKETLVPVGVLMALMGYIVGTFGGLTVAKILSMMAGG